MTEKKSVSQERIEFLREKFLTLGYSVSDTETKINYILYGLPKTVKKNKKGVPNK